MIYQITTDQFGKIDEHTARTFFRQYEEIDHTYGEANSVFRLIGPESAHCSVIGIITMEDIGLADQDNTYILEDVLKACEERSLMKITANDAINYLMNLKSFNFGTKSGTVVLMDDVIDGESQNGKIFLQPDEDGFLFRIGFFTIEEHKKLSKRARFLVGKN